MKLTNILYAIALLVILGSCSSDNDDTTAPAITIVSQDSQSPTSSSSSTSSQVTLSYDITKTGSVTFNSTADWAITNSYGDDITVSPLSGKSGSNTVTVKATDYNCTNSDNTYSFTIRSNNRYGNAVKEVKVVQNPVFTVEKQYYEASADGGTLRVSFNTDADLDADGFYVYYDTSSDFIDMWDNSAEPSGAKGLSTTLGGKLECTRVEATRASGTRYQWEAEMVIKPNTTSRQRDGIFCFGIGKEGNMLSADMEIVQPTPDSPTSTDMSADGNTATLLTHTKGNGVPLVIMGDGFLDTDISSGKYHEAMQQACDYLFAIQPMAALKDYFDVYEVTAVSKNNTFTTSSSTAFNSKFEGGSSTAISGDDDKAVTYAKKVVSSSDIDNTTIIIIINDSRYAGTTSMYPDNNKGDIPGGYSIAYIPMIEGTSSSVPMFQYVLQHEAIGHGFAKLGDEYGYEENGTISNSALAEDKEYQAYGWMRNLSFSSDVTKSYWADFAADSRYASENLGCYEGGETYAKGVYRPTKNSIMKDDPTGFNVAGRVMIYKRCMKLAMGSSWKYDYETFVTFDKQNTSSASSTSSSAKGAQCLNRVIRPFGRPLMHKYSR